MSENVLFKPFRVRRKTRETSFAVAFSPRTSAGEMIALPNRLLGHFLDHFLKASGIAMEIPEMSWPGSWMFDHVLCEDLGQLVGCAVAAIHDDRAERVGVAGRASMTACMDEVRVGCTLSIEGRPRSDWTGADAAAIDGFVDAWYDATGGVAGFSTGTNLRQFLDGFAIGAKATVVMDVQQSGNLHHVFEAAFRALGDAVGVALGIGGEAGRVPGDTSGFAGAATYAIESVEER